MAKNHNTNRKPFERQESSEFTHTEAPETVYRSYSVEVSDRRGFLTATRRSRPGRPKPQYKTFEWEEVGEDWGVFDSYEEASLFMTRTFFYALGCYERIKARVVLTCGGTHWEADVRYYERRRS